MSDRFPILSIICQVLYVTVEPLERGYAVGTGDIGMLIDIESTVSKFAIRRSVGVCRCRGEGDGDKNN